MAPIAPSKTALRVSELSQTAENNFLLRPDKEALEDLKSELGFSGLRKLSFEGALKPMGKTDWELKARLGATVVQPCVITLEPVTTRIDVDVTRRFLKDYTDPDEPEAEMPDDDSAESLGTWIDPAVVMAEALALAAPDYPRKDDVELGQMIYTEPGQKALTDEDAKPFAGLSDLKDKLEGKDN